jgi:hypothetical protein
MAGVKISVVRSVLEIDGASMKNLAKVILVVLAPVFAVGAVGPVQAQISAELAKKCRALMVKAHPTKLYGRTGAEAAQRTYFQICISKKGDMPEAAQESGGPPPNGEEGK